MDSAAIMKNMDLIITVDTSIAHLAGGLDVKTWILLPFAAEWRWMQNRIDTPWYPNTKLFRCKQKNKWDEMMKKVCIDLKTLLNNSLK